MRNFAVRVTAAVIALVLVAPPTWAQEPTELYNGREVIAGEVLVRLRDGQVPPGRLADPDVRDAKRLGGGNVVLVRSRGKDVARLLEEWRLDPAVAWAEPNYVLRAADTIPHDTHFGVLWGLRNTGQTIGGVAGTPGADIGATAAWDITTGSRDNVVGVIDSGVDYTHTDLAANMWGAPSAYTVTLGGQQITCAAGSHGFNAINRTCNPMDDNGHGTHVAGTIGAVGNNGIGVVGVNWIASMIGIKFLNANGSGSTANAIDAIHFAVQVKQQFGAAANIRVLNNSWGGGGFSQGLLEAIQLANANGILFVVAAGNENRNNDTTPSYPANYDVPNVVSVLSTTNRDVRSGFSNYGATTVDIGAPGSAIASTWPGAGYVYSSGTSMAAPHVAGAAALVLAACDLTTPELKSNLLTFAEPVPALAGLVATGARLDVHASLLACAGGVEPTFSLSASPTSRTLAPGEGTNFTLSVAPSGGFDAPVALSLSGLPADASATFTPDVLADGSGNATLAITTASALAPGTYPLTVTGTSGSLTRTAALSLVVQGAPDFSISASPASRIIAPGNNTGYGVTITRGPGFTAAVSFSVSGVPAGVTASFSAPSTTGTQTLLFISNTAGASPGTYPLTITGTSGGVDRTAEVSLTISGSGFTLAALPASQTVDPGGSTAYTVSITRTGGFTGSVAFSVSGLPANATAGFSPSSTTGAGSTLSVTTTSATSGGTYPLTITGTSGTLVRTATATLVVNATADFSLAAAPGSITVAPGEGAAYGVSVNRTGGFAGTVSFSLSGLPSGATGSFAPASTTGNATTLSIATTADVAAGTYPLTITGTSAAVSRTTSVTLVVASSGGFTLTAAPATRTISPGATTNFAITIARDAGVTGPISFTVAGLPASGITSATFLMSHPTASMSVLRIVTDGSVPLGTYPLTITGTIDGGSVSASVTLVIR